MIPSKLYPQLLVLLSVFILQSCSNNLPGVWKNDRIDAGKRSDFHELNNEALGYLKANGFKRLKLMMSKDLNHNSYTERIVGRISNYLNDSKYSLSDEYYIVNKYRDADTVKSAGSPTNDYGFFYQNPEKEMYIAFFLPKSAENKYMISLIFSKFDYGWKISELDVEPYTINRKTGPELFKMAKEAYSKNYLIDAVNLAALANICMKPVDILQYPDEGELHTFYGQIVNEANDKYKFPFTLTDVPTKPRIIRIFNQTDEKGSFPMIQYLTAINLKDTTAIKNENMQIRKVIGKVMPGLDKDKKYVFYAAFNEKPSSLKEVDRFEMTDKLQ
ncbi:hypothetical protein [Mucilaginibacter sp. OK098]|uniref:hypothetical protein n=1 Tax=Mucilaginibacter sp. OK098 TaxID=1855297 RepID=UPI0009137441|nr:hypothetical protein [Mucilaginibacter sp. OK098]SHM58210.1 hypothetical protein SAMN05216524_102589 [Mucilaginibacter sp. OK098]